MKSENCIFYSSVLSHFLSQWEEQAPTLRASGENMEGRVIKLTGHVACVYHSISGTYKIFIKEDWMYSNISTWVEKAK